MVNSGEPLLNVVTSNKPKVLIGLSQKARGQELVLKIHQSQMVVPPAKRRNLSHPRGANTERGKPVDSSDNRESEPQGTPMGLRVRETGGSEGPAVTVGIGVQTLPHPKGAQTSRGSFVTRELEREAENRSS